MHDKRKKRYLDPRGQNPGRDDERRRLHIAVEAARRLLDSLNAQFGADGVTPDHINKASETELYSAKRKAAAVLGQRVRPSDLPDDQSVRIQAKELLQSAQKLQDIDDEPEPADGEVVLAMADHLDRFAIYEMRLIPLESVKLDPVRHPEGDALYHSLQVFDRAKDLRPYDEEFLLAALLHEVGKAIDPRNQVSATLEALSGTISPRTCWLIEQIHQRDERKRKPPADPEWREDLVQFRETDLAGRVTGAPASTVAEALEYLKNLENEDYLN